MRPGEEYRPLEEGETVTGLPSFCRAWREDMGYTQEYVGSKGGVGRACISRFEKGELKSGRALSGYLALGMPIPYELTIDYLKQSGRVYHGK